MATGENFDDGDVPHHIADLLHDNIYEQLSSCFLKTGKGRPPSLPRVTSTNRIYMQLYKMRINNGKSWKWVQDSLHKLFPDYPSNRFRSLVEKIYRGCTLSDVDDISNYLCQSVNLEQVGPLCDNYGILRTHLLETVNLTNFKSVTLTNGFLIELENFREKEKLSYTFLLGWLQTFQSDLTTTEKQLKLDLPKLKKKYAALNKNKNTNPEALAIFMAERVYNYRPDVKTVISGKSPAATIDSPSPRNVLVELNDVLDRNCTCGVSENICIPKCKVCKSLRITTEQCQRLNDELTLQIAAMKEVISAKNKDISSLSLISNNLNIEKDLLHGKLKSTISKLEEELRVLQQLFEKSTSKTQSLHTRLQECKATVESHKVTIKKLKQTIKKIQSRESNYKQRAEKYMVEQRQSKKQVTELQATNDYLHLELHNKLFQAVDSSENVTMATKPKLATRSKGTTFSDSIRKCVIALQGEAGVSAKQCSAVIQVVAKHLFDVDIPSEDLPTEKTALNMADEGHWLSKYQVGEMLSKETWDLHSDGTTRDHRKIMGHQVTLKSGKTMSVGFQQVATEDSATLLDIAIELLQEIGSIVDYDCDNSDSVAREMLLNLCSVMSDRASVNKKFNSDLNKYRKCKLETDENIEFLYCNAHFLLGLSNKCETTLKDIEAEIESAVGHRLGRNHSAKFQSFKGSETGTGRVVRTGSDCLGPRGDEKSGCRAEWEAFCHASNIKSHVSSFRMNRFNNFFYGAGALYHHRHDIVTFLSGGSLKSVNLKLESVLLDMKSPEVTALLRALGIIYYKITGPYWNLMKSETHYLDLYKYIQTLLHSLTAWSADASSLLVEDDQCVFESFAVKSDAVYKSLFTEVGQTEQAITKNALEKLMSACVVVVKKQLADFLDGGVYGSEPSQEQRSKMSHCVLHNLMSEYAFGDLDYSQNRRRNSSIHHHSTIHMLRHNRTVSKWLAGKDSVVQRVLMTKARGQGKSLRKKHKLSEQVTLAKRKDMLRANREKRERQLQKVEDKRKMIVSIVRKHGGPCTTPGDLRALERRLNNQIKFRQAVIWELKFLKDVVRVKHASLQKIVGIRDVNVLRTNLLTIFNDRPDAASTADLPSVQSVRASNVKSSDRSKPPNGLSDTIRKQISPPSTSSKPAKRNKKRKAETQISVQPSKLAKLDFEFSRQGTWVAVAYNGGSWYLGQVVNVQSVSKGSVQFLKHVRGSLYTWPSVEDVDEVEAIHVFDTDIEVTTTNCRVWSVPQHGAILNKFKAVRHLYE